MSGARFWRLATPRGPLVLRRWPPEHPDEAGLQWIHAVIRHAVGQGLALLPVPATTTDGRSCVRHAGHLWELAPWLPGTADYEPERRPEKLRAALIAVAKFHIATADFGSPSSDCLLSVGRQAPQLSDTLLSVGRQAESTAASASPRTAPSPAILRRLARLRDLAATGIGQLSAAVTDRVWPELAPSARRFVELLPRAVPRAIEGLAPLADTPLALQPCLRDVWHDHVLFSGDRVTGLIDFGAVGIDSPAGDVARLLGSMAGDDPVAWRTGLTAYVAVRPLAPDELRAVVALDASGTVLAGCNWIEWLYVARRQFDDRTQVVARFGRLLARLQRLVERSGAVTI